MQALTVSSEPRGAFTLITVSGELDFYTGAELHGQIRDARKTHGPHLVFDLADLRFMDSQGLLVLVNAWRHTAAYGGTIALAQVHDRVRKVLRISGTDQQIPVFDTVDDALARVPGQTTP